MIQYVSGNLFDSNCEALVNPVNCVGVMGAGLALQFKNRYPKMFAAYNSACIRGLLQPGSVQPIEISTTVNPRWIINLPTKNDWREHSQLEWVESGLIHLRKFIVNMKIKSVAVPALGCGYGNLSWDSVKPLIGVQLSFLEGVDVKVYPPFKLERGPMIDSNPSKYVG